MFIITEIEFLNIINEKYYSFSKSFRKLSDYIRENLNQVAFHSIKELENRIGVSAPTISRFVKELGFEGYSDFQKCLANITLKSVIPMNEVKKSIQNQSDTTLERIIIANSLTLEHLYSAHLQNEFDTLISRAKDLKGKLYITASRSSFTVAYFLHFMLNRFMSNIEILAPEQVDVSTKLAYITQDDMLIAISYGRYTKITYEIVSFFSDKNAYISSITDSREAPIALKSNNVLIAKNHDEAYAFSGAMVICNAIVTAMGQINREETLKMMKTQDEIALHGGIYI